MGYPGRRGKECADCRAELQEAGGGVLRCPWAESVPIHVEAGEVSCGRPYVRHRLDPAGEYVRDNVRKP